MRYQLYTIPVALGLVASAAIAQDGATTTNRKVSDAAESTNFHRDDQLRGMDLWSTKDAEGERDDLGDINDFIINARSGKISHIVISSGGIGSVGDTLRALAWDQVEWSTDEEGDKIASVSMTEDQFEALPGFDAKNIDKLTGPSAVEANAQRLKDSKDKMDIEDARDAAKGARAASALAASNHLCSTIADLGVMGPRENELFTSIGSLVFDCDNAAVAFVTLEANDENYLVPFNVLTIRPKPTDEPVEDADEIEYCAYSPKSEAAMKGAPAIDEDELLTAENSKFRKRVYAYYELEGPAYEVTKKKSSAKGADARGQ